jgi:NAD(P)H-hydrate epimerase
MYQADRAAIASGVAGLSLMEAAGTAIARAIRRRFRPRPVAVLCGPGNNGGDGFVVVRLLAADGWPVRLGLLGAADALTGDAAANRDRWRGPVRPVSPDLLDGSPLVVDALFGAGLARPLDGPAADAIAAVNARGLDCVGVDIPSGVHGDTGEILGIAPRCRLTVTFFRAKPGHLLLPGRMLCGELLIADIGIPASVLDAIRPATYRNGPNLWQARLPSPQAEGNKYSRGHALIVGGREMTGAARLAAEAARRIGSGLVTIAAPAPSLAIYAAGRPGTIVTEADASNAIAALLADRRRTCALIGPGAGIGDETRRRVLALLKTGKPLVLDADALTVFADRPDQLFAAITGPVVLTPHEGEFRRLFAPTGDKLSRAREAARLSGAVVLLKGPDTVIAAADGRAAINADAPATLATAGSGDVLAGFVLGLISQGMEPFDAACAAVWLHGAVAARFGPGLIAEDLIDGLPTVLALLPDIRRRREEETA